MAFTFLENALNLGISNNAPVPHPKLHAEYFENMFSLTTERGGKNNYDLFYRNSISESEDNLEHGCLYFL